MINAQGAKEYVPFYKVKAKNLMDSVKDLTRDGAWRRMNSKPIQKIQEKYKLERN